VITEFKQVIFGIKANSRCRHKVNERDDELSFGTALYFLNWDKNREEKTSSPHSVSIFFWEKNLK